MSASLPASRRPNPLLAVLGRMLESVLNRAIDLDPDTRARLDALDGRAVTLDLAGSSGRMAPALRIVVGAGRLQVGPAFEGDSALRVSATPGSLIGLALARGRDGGLPPGRVSIAGDAELARRLEQLASRFAPDIDAAFARAFGDVAGFRIARAFRGAFAWSRTSAQSLARDTAEFLTEEGRGVNVILDMGELLYMNSTGLNIMISVLTRTRKAGGQVLLANISHGVRQLFVVTKLDTVFPILDTVELALAKLRP